MARTKTQVLYDQMTLEERKRYPFPRDVNLEDMTEEQKKARERFRKALNKRSQRHRGPNAFTMTQQLYDQMTLEERKRYPFPRDVDLEDMTEEQKKARGRFRKLLNKRAQGPTKQKPVSEISEEQRLRRNEVARQSRARRAQSNAPPPKRIKTKPHKRDIVRHERILAEHQALYDAMSSDDHVKFPFPRDVRPSSTSAYFPVMTDQDREYYHQYRKYVRDTRRKEEKAKMDEMSIAVPAISSSSSSSGTLSENAVCFKECPGCNVMIERTGGCAVMSCSNCDTEFDWNTGFKTRDQKLKEKRELMRKDREQRPEYYKEKERTKYKKMMEDPEKRENERERQRLKERRNRERTSIEEKREYEKVRREIKRARATGRFKRCPICDDTHESRISDFCPEHRRQEKWIKKREIEVLKMLREWEYHPSLHDKTGPCFDGGDSRRSDFVLSGHDTAYTIIVEVDENFHRHNTLECETSRLASLRDQFTGKPLYVIRYAPERRKAKQPTQCIISSKSKKALQRAIAAALELPVPEEGENPLGYAVCFVGYPQTRIDALDDTHQKMQHAAMQAIVKANEVARVRTLERVKKRNQRK